LHALNSARQPSNRKPLSAEKASHAAWLAFEALGAAVPAFRAESLEGIACKARVIARQAQGLEASEISSDAAASVLADVLELYGADYAEPDSEARATAAA